MNKSKVLQMLWSLEADQAAIDSVANESNSNNGDTGSLIKHSSHDDRYNHMKDQGSFDW